LHLASTERAERAPLIEQRFGDSFAQRQFSRRAEARQHVVIDGNLVLAPTERAERDPLIEQRAAAPISMFSIWRNQEFIRNRCKSLDRLV
jgi:hypothetical protein